MADKERKLDKLSGRETLGIGAMIAMALVVVTFITVEASSRDIQQSGTIADKVEKNPEAVLEALNKEGNLDEVIGAYIQNNPEVILDTLRSYQKAQRKAASRPVSEEAQAVIEDPSRGQLSYVGGPEDAPVTVVKFHDPNCPYCRKSISTVGKLIERRDDVRVGVRVVPMLGPASEDAAQVAVALAEEGKYLEWYKALGGLKQKLDADGAIAFANKVVNDVDDLESAMNTQRVENLVSTNLKIARERANVQGTPTFIINGKPVSGAVGYDKLVSMIEEAKAMNKGGD